MLKYAICFLSVISFPLCADVTVDVADYQLWSTTNGTDIIRLIPTGVAVNNAQAPSCPDADSYMVKSTLSASSIDRIYSSLLAAKMSSKPVTITISGCETSRPAIVNVIMK